MKNIKHGKINTVTYLLTLLITGMCMMLCGCAKAPEDKGGEDFVIYYLNPSETGLYTMPYEVKATNTKEMTDEILNVLRGQSDKLLYKTVIDNFCTLESVSINENQLLLGFGDDYRSMPPITEVLARASIVRTMGQIPGIDGISFVIGNEPLADAAGNLIGVMNPEQFITNAGNEINAYERVQLTLYFADESGQKLLRTKRSVVYSSNIPLEKLVADEIIKGPGNENEGYPTINPNAKAVSVTVIDGICYVNMDPEYLSGTDTASNDAAVYSITNSLVELDGINKVQISVDDAQGNAFSQSGASKEKDALTGLFERNLDIVESNNVK